MMNEIKIGENIRALRKEKKIGQEALAGALGVTVQAVSKWETSGSMPDITLLPEIADYFGVTIEELFYGRTETVPPEEVSVLTVEPVEPEETSEQPPISDEEETSEPKNEERSGWSFFDQMNKLTAGLSKKIGEISIRIDKDHWSKENETRSDIPDDERLRVVQFIGNRMVQIDEISDQPILLAIPKEKLDQPHDSNSLIVTVYGSATIQGNIGGNLTADGDVSCGMVGGSVNSDGDVNCGNVGGNLKADGDVTCNIVAGSVRSDGDVHCGNVMGSVTADGDVICEKVSGGIHCDGGVAFDKD